MDFDLNKLVSQVQSYGSTGQSVLDFAKTLEMPGKEDLIQFIVVESEYTPKIEIHRPLGRGGSPSIGGRLLRTLKPRVTLKLADPIPPQVFTPFGVPGESQWPKVKIGLIGGGALLVFLLLRGIFK